MGLIKIDQDVLYFSGFLSHIIQKINWLYGLSYVDQELSAILPGFLDKIQGKSEGICGKRQDSDFIFTFNGKPVINIKVGFGMVCNQVGIEDFQFHDLRPIFASQLHKKIGEKGWMSIEKPMN
jgi:hypothetical protein